ncbi:M20 metallopeptidase family protein [Ornithinimicrobium tianjinense]|uniref:N-acyl-L-amino acid amidohydrolase n=1 Tax=Ornithinimicrobium tianjinense TaxID=1195761 RepID=A0A917F7V6_9MICO|nr:M20 family metallopeptidase [Ornithinimicrobium tianjinense]GGF58650.1 N-acyl-L-amino acid amidohydrolase [Ornithinimicrobium tianjinense]
MTAPAVTTGLADLRERWFAALREELPGALELRRSIHADPCLSGQEEPTARLVEEAMGVALERVAGTGRVGRLGPVQGPSVLLRGELDALPLHEATGAAYASRTGHMHACGHDVHLAALVAVVRAAARLDLPVGLVPLLQPREETYPSGAQDAVASGALQRYAVAAAVGAHVHPGVAPGHVATGAGVVNAAADEIEVVLRGRGGHGAYPHHAADPVAAISHVVLGLPELMRRTVSPMRPSVLSVGHLQAGQPSANVLPAEARLLATLRTTDPDDRVQIQEAVRVFAARQAEAFGLEAQVTVTSGEPVLVNDPAVVERMDAWLGRSGLVAAEPMRSLGADDFSFFGEVVPSVMAFVGVTVDGHDAPPPLHHPEFLPTDEAVGHVAGALVCGYLAAAELVAEGLLPVPSELAHEAHPSIGAVEEWSG